MPSDPVREVRPSWLDAWQNDPGPLTSKGYHKLATYTEALEAELTRLRAEAGERARCSECVRLPEGATESEVFEHNKDCICGGAGTRTAQLQGYRACIKYHQSRDTYNNGFNDALMRLHTKISRTSIGYGEKMELLSYCDAARKESQ